jgi:heme/copper-type cytochrome/quinol oxidase subunit 2
MNLLSLPMACATCLPNADSAEANAQGFAILVMLGLLGLVFSVLFYVIFSFARKQRRFAESQALAMS